LWVLLAVCVALALVVAGTALTQPGGGRGGRGKGGGGWGKGGGGKMNPDMIFNFMSQGKDYIVISEIRRGREQAEEYAQRKGITNGQLTREQFAEYMNERFASWQSNRGGGAGGPAASADPAKDYFDRLDRNRDGVLTDNEIPEALKADLSKWDTNRDGKVQLDEYRAYFKAYPPADAAPAAVSVAPAASPLEELDKRATVYRAGNLPKELQKTWFEEYDTDKDGQVGLYEWKAGGRPISEFRGMDANGDGFITAEEALRWVRKNGGGNTGGNNVASAGQGGRGQGMGGGGGSGRWQGNGGPSGFGRGPNASATDGSVDQQPRMGRGGRGKNGGNRGQRGDRGGNRGGMNWGPGGAP
jgi:Ca2+-binding EF-hand superfamily protein